MAFIGRFLANIFTNVKAWAQALLVGAGLAGLDAVKVFVGSFDPSDPDPVAGGVKGLIILFLLKALGLIAAVKVAGAAVRASSPS